MRPIFSRLSGRSFPIKPWLLSVMIPILAVTACTRYQPLGRGSKVPWAEALSDGRGGPIGSSLYRVGEGDALSVIAERYGVQLASLAVVNNIEPPYILYPGEVLRIPRDGVAPTIRPDPQVSPPIVETALPELREQPPAEPARPRWTPRARPSQEAARPEVRSESAGRRYVVSPGDSLSTIAARHGLRMSELVTANGIEPPYRIRPGQGLVIPPTEADRRRQSPRRPAESQQAGTLLPPPPLSADGFLWPIRGEVISTFEQNSAKGRSGGITIAARKGTPVRAADNGIVAYAGEALRGYGQMILLRHAEGYVTLYAHNDALLVSEGEVVRRGQAIAEVGNSGDVIDSQLHFELRKGTEPIDPAKALAGLPGREVGQLLDF